LIIRRNFFLFSLVKNCHIAGKKVMKETNTLGKNLKIKKSKANRPVMRTPLFIGLRLLSPFFLMSKAIHNDVMPINNINSNR
jgi:hypothetical protein